MSFVHLGATTEGWPPFAAGFAAWCRANRSVVEPTALVLQAVGATMISSILFAGTGAPLAFVGATLIFFLEKGAPAEVVKTQCKLATQYASASKLAIGITTLLAPFTGVGLPATPALASLTALLGTLEVSFKALSEGRTPRTADLTTLADIGGIKLSDQLAPLTSMLKQVDTTFKLGQSIPGVGPQLTAKAAELRALVAKLPKAPAKVAAPRAPTSTTSTASKTIPSSKSNTPLYVAGGLGLLGVVLLLKD